jgi:hypothetical protein
MRQKEDSSKKPQQTKVTPKTLSFSRPRKQQADGVQAQVSTHLRLTAVRGRGGSVCVTRVAGKAAV